MQLEKPGPANKVLSSNQLGALHGRQKLALLCPAVLADVCSGFPFILIGWMSTPDL